MNRSVMKTHTPGPWTARLAAQSNGPNYYSITNGKWGAPLIAMVDDTSDADARLIAAAPDLLAALKRLMAYDFGSSEGAKQARDAIAKAEWKE